MSKSPYSLHGRLGTVPMFVAFPITAYFGALRIDFESAAEAKRWLGEQLERAPEQDRLGWLTKREADPAGPSWDSPRLLTSASPCAVCGTEPADLEHIGAGPVCCGCLNEIATFFTNLNLTP